jgi:uncharacterized membrane protein
MLHRIKLHFKRYFLTGLFVLLPVVVSLKVFVWLVTYVDDLLKPLLRDVLGEYFFGIGIAIIIVLLFVVGMFAQNYIGKRLVRLVELIFDRLPFIRTIYSVVRQLIEPFYSEKGNSFRQVVLIEYPMEKRYSLGFIANEDAGTVDGEKLVTVFLPSNHLHLGYLVIMPAKDAIPVDIGVEDALKTIVSCGIVIPGKFELEAGRLVDLRREALPVPAAPESPA